MVRAVQASIAWAHAPVYRRTHVRAEHAAPSMRKRKYQGRHIGRILALVTTLIASSIAFVVVTATAADAAPLSARSYYVKGGFNGNWAYQAGCTAGTADLQMDGKQTRVVVLDFGALTVAADGSGTFSGFGDPMSIADARAMVVQWAEGYWTCTDTTSVAYIALGTNNSGGTLTSAAGARLAQAVNTAVSDVSGGVDYYLQARPIGGIDFEDFDEYGSTSTTLNAKSIAFLNGYNANTAYSVVNFGAASGCPSASAPSATSCNPPLQAETIYQVSWSGAAYPLPEIYNTSGTNAEQWRYLSRYGYNKHSGQYFSTFMGVMAQSGVCSQQGGCSGTDNDPSTAWTQLNSALHEDPVIAVSPWAPTNIWSWS